MRACVASVRAFSGETWTICFDDFSQTTCCVSERKHACDKEYLVTMGYLG